MHASQPLVESVGVLGGLAERGKVKALIAIEKMVILHLLLIDQMRGLINQRHERVHASQPAINNVFNRLRKI